MTIGSRMVRKIILKQSGKRSFHGNHPWILEHSIHEPGTKPQVGEVVDLVREDGKFVGRGFYNPHSRIRIRLFTWDPEESLDERLILKRLDRAIEHRGRLGLTDATNAIRLVFSEADQLSGLVVDRYAEHLVIQLTSAALQPFISAIADRLFALYRPLTISLLMDERSAKTEGLEAQHRFLVGSPSEEHVEIQENGLRWTVDLAGGQKTGYYLDQRENRLAATRWIPKNARVLDVCTYVGGFALTIARYCETASIVAVDSSEKALQAAQKHAEMNGLAERLKFIQSDFFDFLSDQVDGGHTYDAIVLDPPRLASSREHLKRALAAYHRLNYLAMRLLREGGTLITCSCSGRVSRPEFREVLKGVASRAKREVQVLEERAAAPDHPSCLSCPETDYLKCMMARVL
jgi:23S rRNA (cytosine1962-C5)-methyltransferase